MTENRTTPQGQGPSAPQSQDTTRRSGVQTAADSFREWWGVRQGASVADWERAQWIWYAAYVAVHMNAGRSAGRIVNEVAAELIDQQPDLEPFIEEWFARKPVVIR